MGAQKDTCGLKRASADSSRGRKSWHRASMFRNRGNSSRTINLRYSDGSSTTINQPGHLNTTMHLTILKALEQRATRYRVKGKLSEVRARSHSWGLDKTGTIDITCLRFQEEIQQQEQIDIRGVSDEVLQVHGVPPGRKEKGITRLIYKNKNGISNRLCGNDKLDKAKDLIDELSTDVVAYSKHHQNLQPKDNRNRWNQLFRGGEADINSVVAHNVHEADCIGQIQVGGTGRLLFVRKYARAEGVTLPPSEELCPSGGSNSPAAGVRNLTRFREKGKNDSVCLYVEQYGDVPWWRVP
jgi:hypothetical protein